MRGYLNNDTRSSRTSGVSDEVLSNNTKRPSADKTGAASRANDTLQNEFDVHRVYDLFVSCLREHDNLNSPIGTQDYIDGYRELLKFVDQLGYIFKFVKDDVVDKLAILQTFIESDYTETPNFDTIQKAVSYESAHLLIQTNPKNFTRTLLRLHRALLFIIQFLRGLADRPPLESTASIAAQSYDATLYHYHPFLVRKSVKIGFRILPSRRQLDDIIFHGRKDELFDQYKTFIQVLQQIYDVIQAFYAENKYLELP